MHKTVFSQLLHRRPNSHKYDFGHVLVIGGSPGMVGAPLLAGRAALRVGAGLVTIASTKNVIDMLEKRVEEIMTLTIENNRQLLDFITKRKVNSLIIGPGLREDSAELVGNLIKSVDLPTVLDGGALTILSEKLDLLGILQRPRTLILTPHLGEFQRFFAEPLPKDQTKLKHVAQKFAKNHGIILVLKGHPTYVSSRAGSIYENTTGGPGLATAGSGDVLAGVITGLIAQGIEPTEAAKAGVYLHGLAGDLAVEQKTQAGMIASDVIEFIPAALESAK